MDKKYAICVLEAIGSGLTLSNENDKEPACVIAIETIAKVMDLKKICKQKYIGLKI